MALDSFCVQIFTVNSQGKLLSSPESYFSLFIYVVYIYIVHFVPSELCLWTLKYCTLCIRCCPSMNLYVVFCYNYIVKHMKGRMKNLYWSPGLHFAVAELLDLRISVKIWSVNAIVLSWIWRSLGTSFLISGNS